MGGQTFAALFWYIFIFIEQTADKNFLPCRVAQGCTLVQSGFNLQAVPTLQTPVIKLSLAQRISGSDFAQQKKGMT